MARRGGLINLPAPYLKRVWLESQSLPNRDAYPFCLPFLRGGLDLYFDHAITTIVGENGAGKSTMVKILAGVYRPDSVDLLIDGQPVTLHGPAAAQQAGLAVIYQEPCRRPPRPPTRTPGSGT